MAGIKQALQRVADGKHKGQCVAVGELYEPERDAYPAGYTTPRFMIVRLEHDDGLITVHDHDGDVRIADGMAVKRNVMLRILDNYTAEWRPHPEDPKS